MQVATDRSLLPAQVASVRYLRVVVPLDPRGVVLDLALDPLTDVAVVNGWPVDPPDPAAPSRLQVWLGRGPAGRVATVLLAVRVAEAPLGAAVHVHGSLRDADGVMRSPVSEGRQEGQGEHQIGRWNAVAAAVNDAQPVNDEVVQAVTAALAGAAGAQVREAQYRGAHDEAAAIVLAVSRHLRLLSAGRLDAERAIAHLHATLAGGTGWGGCRR